MSEHEQTEVVTQSLHGRQIPEPWTSAPCSQVWAALSVAQGKIVAPKKTKEATVRGTTEPGREYEYKYKFAPLDAIVEAIREPFAENGLYRQQYIVSRGDQWFVRTIIGHASGEWIAGDYPIILDPRRKGAQGFASGASFARRYGLSFLAGIVPEEDDDAEEIMPEPPVRREPRQQIRQEPPRRPAAVPVRINGHTLPPDDPEAAQARDVYMKLVKAITDAKLPQDVDRLLFKRDEAGNLTDEQTDEFALIDRHSGESAKHVINCAKARKQELRASA